MRDTLAIHGGTPVRTTPFPPYPVIGEAERRAVIDVLDEGRLSTFIASPGEHFLGGRRIREFERAFAEYHSVKFAVALNSATAALHAALVALGLGPDQEVIVPPYTFTSTATSALMVNAIPVFADVEVETFGLDPKAVEAVITPRTKAIIPVHLFGHSVDMDGILDVARRHALRVIEDVAQAPGGRWRGRLLGTLGDCGIFSFQESKNLMTGEGGMLITNDPAIAEVAQLVRNHGEAVVPGQKVRSYKSEILGFNFRMTEFEAALGLVQLAGLDAQNDARRRLADHLTKGIAGIPWLRTPIVKPCCVHSFYVYPLLFDEAAAGFPRTKFTDALAAEGVPLGAGYVKPLYFSPIYQERRGLPFQLYRGDAAYAPGICPVTEDLHTKRMIVIPVVRPPATERDIDDIATAIHKIAANRAALRKS